MAKLLPRTDKRIKITVEGKDSLPWGDLAPFQGTLKHLEKTQYEALRKTIIDMGFSFVVHVWKNKGTYHIIDGHQRMSVVKQMVEVEGWTIGKIPVVYIEAKTIADARRKVLASASQYGKMTGSSLTTFALENHISLEELAAGFNFPEVDFGDIASSFEINKDGAIPDVETSKEADRSMKSGSDQVKQLQLFFAASEYDEFISKIEVLKQTYKTENVTDTLLEMVREKHKAAKKA